MEKNLQKVLQTPFDKAFVEVVEFLSENWMHHRKFRFRKDLLDSLGYNHLNWAYLKSGQRGLPKNKINQYRNYLIKEFDVRPGFLDTYKGDMFSTEPVWLKNTTLRTKEELLAQLQAMEKENKLLKEQAKALAELAEARKQQLDAQKNVKKSDKK